MLRRQKWKVISLLLIVVTLVVVNVRFKIFAFHPFATHEAGDLKVFCLNVHSTGEGFVERSFRVDSLIRAEDPDFVLLTEYQDTCSMVLDSLLKERYDYCQRGIRSNYNLTECVYSKWRIDSVADIHVDVTSAKAQEYLETNSALGYHIYHSAIMRYEIESQENPIVIYTCHLSSNNYLNEVDSLQYNLHSSLKGLEQRWIAYQNGSFIRELEVEAICDNISKTDASVLVMGDMNDISSSSCLDLLEDKGLKDAWWQGGLGYGGTFEEGLLRLRIDHVYYSKGLDLTNVRFFEEELSDHNPLSACFRFR